MPLGHPNPARRWNALVVDDEAAIRLTLSAILEMNRLTVQTAASASHACQLLIQEAFDIVITDLKMESDTAGFAVAEFAAKRYPNLKTIIVSAYPKLAVDWRSHGAHAFIQ